MSLDEAFRQVVREELRTVVREELERARSQGVSDGEYLTTSQAAKLAGVHVATVRGWVKQRLLPEHRVGKRLRILRNELATFIAAPRVAPVAEEPEDRADRVLELRRRREQ